VRFKAMRCLPPRHALTIQARQAAQEVVRGLGSIQSDGRGKATNDGVRTRVGGSSHAGCLLVGRWPVDMTTRWSVA
jgi:hypothetical protein